MEQQVIVHRRSGPPLVFRPNAVGVLRYGYFVLRLTADGLRVTVGHSQQLRGELLNCYSVEFPDGGRYYFPPVPAEARS